MCGAVPLAASSSWPAGRTTESPPAARRSCAPAHAHGRVQVIAAIAKHDFPDNWPELLPGIVEAICNKDDQYLVQVRVCVGSCLRACVRACLRS